mmetsp:Transcript_6996/g.15072  ORF Transcript_6996/g.15072 Transcript_6996/m.15072 type:complete len:464 (+) Transcript_6996:64-1455(+)
MGCGRSTAPVATAAPVSAPALSGSLEEAVPCERSGAATGSYRRYLTVGPAQGLVTVSPGVDESGELQEDEEDEKEGENNEGAADVVDEVRGLAGIVGRQESESEEEDHVVMTEGTAAPVPPPALKKETPVDDMDSWLRRTSWIGSDTDKALEQIPAFDEKEVQQVGEPICMMGIGYSCRKGLKAESPNQDSWFVVEIQGAGLSLYGVFDGHGSKGHDVSNFVKKHLPDLIVKDRRLRTPEMPTMLKQIFKTAQSMIQNATAGKTMEALSSGTTATLVVHDHRENKLTMAHVGDSGCCLGRLAPGAEPADAEAVPLTKDHKPDEPLERHRILASGGEVEFDGYASYRVYAKGKNYPGLNMSRALGDIRAIKEAGVSCEPDVSERIIEPEDHVLLLCSDGVWEFMNYNEAVTFACKFSPAQAMAAADQLAQEAWRRWIVEENGSVVDDITALVIFLRREVVNAQL